MAPRLGPDEWTGEALLALAEGGLTTISVERLATKLGATKGSFYWHFKDRNALIARTLERWEAEYTDDVIEWLATIDDPALRFRRLLESGLADNTGSRIDGNLLADSDDPMVADALRRTSAKRLACVSQMFEQLGSSDCSDRALLALTAYVGLAQLRRASPKLLPRGKKAKAYIDHTVERLLA